MGVWWALRVSWRVSVSVRLSVVCPCWHMLMHVSLRSLSRNVDIENKARDRPHRCIALLASRMLASGIEMLLQQAASYQALMLAEVYAQYVLRGRQGVSYMGEYGVELQGAPIGILLNGPPKVPPPPRRALLLCPVFSFFLF